MNIKVIEKTQSHGIAAVYVPIDELYFDDIMIKSTNLDICYDYMDQEWESIHEDSFEDLYTNKGRILLFDGEGLWINQNELLSLTKQNKPQSIEEQR